MTSYYSTAKDFRISAISDFYMFVETKEVSMFCINSEYFPPVYTVGMSLETTKKRLYVQCSENFLQGPKLIIVKN